jgi:hypothetical protein
LGGESEKSEAGRESINGVHDLLLMVFVWRDPEDFWLLSPPRILDSRKKIRLDPFFGGIRKAASGIGDLPPA